MIKIDLITGFLGSGKTTFIRRYAQHLIDSGENIAILENDYGAVNVDALLLEELEGDHCDIETVAGGCDHDCHVRRFRTKLIAMGMLGYDRVIVEPSGIYDVDEFFDVLHEDPLDRWYEIGNVITIMDIHTTDSGLSRETRYFLMSQTACAGLLILSHIEDGPDRASDASHIAHRPDGTTDASHIAKHPDEDSVLTFINGIMGEFRCSRRFEPEDLLIKDWNGLTDEDLNRIESSGYQLADHIKLSLEDDNGFQSLYFLNLNEPLSVMKEKALGLLQDPAAGKILRIKGFHFENGCWHELNISGSATTVQVCSAGQEVFIVIGENLDRERIARHLEIGDEVWHNGNVYVGAAISSGT